MGMFDCIRSSFNLGEEFTNVELRTKDIEDGIGGTLTFYWIDPQGVLWYPDYSQTKNFIIIEEDDPNYDPERLFLNYNWESTGKNGKCAPYRLTKYIRVHHLNWQGDWEERPTLRLHFVNGVIKDYKNITKCNYDAH